MLEQQLEKANSLSMRSSDKNQSEEKEKVQKADTQRQEEGSPSFRALQVADMTTFMAKLLQKLTEMSCKLANTFIRESNELHATLRAEEQSLAVSQNSSRSNLDGATEVLKPFEFTEEDHL